MPPLPGEVREPAPPLGRSLPGSILSSPACHHPVNSTSTARPSYSSENNKTYPILATASYMGDNNKAQGRSTQSAVMWIPYCGRGFTVNSHRQPSRYTHNKYTQRIFSFFWRVSKCILSILSGSVLTHPQKISSMTLYRTL